MSTFMKFIVYLQKIHDQGCLGVQLFGRLSLDLSLGLDLSVVSSGHTLKKNT